MAMPFVTRGDGPSLVLMPGGLTGWLSWIPFVDRLSPPWRVIRLQLLSVHFANKKQPLPDDYSPKTESTALAETVEALKLATPIDLVAWSYGAAVTLDFALDHPDWIRTLTLIEPPAFWVLPQLDPDDDFGVRLNRDDITEADLEAFLNGAGFVAPGDNARELPQWAQWVEHRQSLRANPSIVDFRADRSRIPKFTPPVLLVKGTGSAKILHHVIDELSAELPNSETVEFPGGHAPHIVSMEPFLERLTTFLQ